MKKINVLLADDHKLLRQGLIKLLEEDPEIVVCGEASDGREAIQKVESLNPEIVIMDIAMPNLNGLEALKQIRKKYPQIKVLILSMHKNEEYVLQSFKAGASGFILKDSAATEVFEAIKIINKGEPYLSPKISKIILHDLVKTPKKSDEISLYELLTSREREVFQLLAEGKKNIEIGKTLFISVKTVETHRAHIFEKLHLNNFTDLVKYAIKIGVITAEHPE